MYRGKLIEAEDNMNSQMASVTVTYRDGRVAQLENIYIRSGNCFILFSRLAKKWLNLLKTGNKP